MPVLLDESQVDQEAEVLDQVMDAGQEAPSFYPQGTVGDLSHGGKVGDATLYPTQGHKRVAKGRATARQAWAWDGTPSVLTLAWNPEGTQHDGGRHYLRKRHCTCCNSSGFFGECKVCIKNNCPSCGGGTDKKKIIPCFYLKKEQVPFPREFYGPVNCFIPHCPRRGAQGFKTEEDMRLHAMGTHGMEYRARQEALAERKTTEADDLRRELAELRSLVLKNGSRAEGAVATPEALLYVKEPGPLRRTRRPRKQQE